MKDSTEPKNILNSPLWVILLTIILAYTFNIYFHRLPLDSISEGDFGRDLYNFYLVSKGQLPYIDFNWIYGPLIPVIYGIVFKIAGVSVLNAVSFWYLMFFICVYIIFYLVSKFSNGLFGSIAGILFVVYYAFIIQTFNHLAGTFFILLALLFIKFHLDTDKPVYLYLTTLSCFFVAITKLNMGLAFSGPLFLVVILYYYFNKKPFRHIIQSLILLFLLTILIYGVLIASSPVDQLSKSFPYSKSSLSSARFDLLTGIFIADAASLTFDIRERRFSTLIFYITSLNYWYYFIPVISLLFAYLIFIKNRFNKDVSYILILSMTSIFCLHEFIMVGSVYSLRFWVLAQVIVLIFFLLQKFIEYCKDKKFYRPAITAFGIILFITMIAKLHVIILFKNYPANFYPTERVKACFSNTPWFHIMVGTLEYIEKNIKPDEKLLSIPYNAFYNFASGRDFPSKHTEFLYLSNINEKEQQQIIDNLEKYRVKHILYSHKTGQIAFGVGEFGETHCKILNDYIVKNYDYDVSFFYKEQIHNLAPISFFKRKTPFKDITGTAQEKDQ
jgi:hypothetical protein